MVTKRRNRPVILAVDDMAINLRTIKLPLEKEYDVLLAKSGNLALNIVSTQKIDLILLDIEMPGMSGFEFMEKLKAIPLLEKIPPVIFVTAYANPELLTHAKIVGAAGYIIKPFEPDVLCKKVLDVLSPPVNSDG